MREWVGKLAQLYRWERQLWLDRWESLSFPKRVLPAVLILIYGSFLAGHRDLRVDHVLALTAMMVLIYGGPRFDSLKGFVMPFGFSAVCFDAVKYLHRLGHAQVRVAEPYFFDKSLFGISTAAGAVLTPNEWWQLHTHPFLDLYSGIFYFAFIPFFVMTAGYFRVFYGTEGNRLPWAFFTMNLVGYSTYFWYPAAPPWYVAQYGFGPAVSGLSPNAAGALRVDQLLGVSWFADMYAKGSVVYGAVPSLHIAYPLICLYYAFRFGALRTWTFFFYASMCFAAVYLNHHYILDLIWGSVYALLVCTAIDRVLDRRVTASARFAS